MKDSPIRLRIVRTAFVALFVGGCVFAVAYLAAWRQLGGSPYVAWYRMTNLGRLFGVQEAVVHYREETGKLPESIDDLLRAENKHHGVDEEGRPIDLWSNRINYTRVGDDFEIYTVGRDGKPGGRGMDADLYVGTEHRPIRDSWEQCFPTLWQFAFDLNTKGMFGACVASGLLAMAIYLVLSYYSKNEKVGVKTVAMNLFATLLFSLLIAAILVVSYAPWGH